MATVLSRLVPWRIQSWLNIHWPPGYHFVRYGQWNANTAEHWDEAWARHGADGFRATDEGTGAARARIIARVPKGCQVLDLGCGVGELLTVLRDNNGCVGSGLDISAVAAERARKAGFNAVASPLPKIPFGDAQFDAVTCTDCLEHVTDALGTIDSVWRVLRPGGVAIFLVPDGATDREDVHIHRFTAERFRKVLSRRFDVESLDLLVDGEPALLAVVVKK